MKICDKKVVHKEPPYIHPPVKKGDVVYCYEGGQRNNYYILADYSEGRCLINLGNGERHISAVDGIFNFRNKYRLVDACLTVTHD